MTAALLLTSVLSLVQLDSEPPQVARDVVVVSDPQNSDRLQVSWTAPHEHYWNGGGEDPEMMVAMLQEAGVFPDDEGGYAWGGACDSYEIGASLVAPGADLAAWFSTATPVSGPMPSTPGDVDTATIDGLLPNRTYYVVIRSLNFIPLDSYSLPVTGMTSGDAVAPAAIDGAQATLTGTTVTLQWAASGDDGTAGSARRYRIYRLAGQPVSEGNLSFAELTLHEGVAGGLQSRILPDLAPGTTHHFALKAEDDGGNLSPLSTNNPSATIAGGGGGGGQAGSEGGCGFRAGASPFAAVALLALVLYFRR